MTIKEEKELKRYITNLIKESLVNEAAKRENKKGKMSKLRTKVINDLKKNGRDAAQYAYKLWPDKEPDSCRSFFYKCRDGKYGHSFKNSEIVRLYSLLSNNSV